MKLLQLIALFLLFTCFRYGESQVTASVNDVDEDSLLGVRMQHYVVTNHNFARKELYTWTTTAQIEELRNGKELLSRSVSSKGKPSVFDMVVADSSFNKFPMITVLRDPRFSKKRFAWVAGWPTVMGWENEKYGDQLLKITLKDSAIIVAFHPYCDSVFTYADATGKVLSEEFVLAHKERIAAVYFSQSKPGSRTQMRGTMGKPRKYNSISIHYREYVICNEQMVAKWEYATENVKQELNDEIALIDDFGKYLREEGTHDWYYNYDPAICDGGDCYKYATSLYNCAIAFPNDYYLQDPGRMLKISATLKRALAAQQTPIAH